MKEYMTLPEFMEYFDISESTYTRWVKAGLSVTKVGQKVYIKNTQVREFLDRYEVCNYQR